MSRTYFTKEPGFAPTREEESGGYCHLMGDDTPDVVRLPQDLGGALEKVEEVNWSTCACQRGHQVKTLTLESVRVQECLFERQFFWLKK